MPLTRPVYSVVPTVKRIRSPRSLPSAIGAPSSIPLTIWYSWLSTSGWLPRRQLPATLAGTIQGNGRHPRGLSNTLNGNVEFRIDQGRIEKGTIVPKILMILDIPSRLQGKVDLNREGMPFDKLSGTVAIQNGILTTKNLLIDSPVIKISGAGSYDMPTDQLDMALVVSPFGSYTKLLQGIPLFGKLLAGERKGFTTAFFDVKGSLQDPQIVNRPMKSVGAGLTGLAQLAFDVLRNTLMLPAEIFSSGDEKAPLTKPAPSPPAAP